jgi:CheY-like chemotaxis protein
MSRSILMLEHDEDDRYITQAVFDEQGYDVKLIFANTSEEFFSLLTDFSRKNVKFPSLILLDYHAKPSNAVEVLTQLKSSVNYKYIPAIVLSGSVSNEILKECYDAGASSFIQKPIRSIETDKKIANFFHYWFHTVELP